jgi:hypothetical protein
MTASGILVDQEISEIIILQIPKYFPENDVNVDFDPYLDVCARCRTAAAKAYREYSKYKWRTVFYYLQALISTTFSDKSLQQQKIFSLSLYYNKSGVPSLTLEHGTRLLFH